MSSHGKNVQHAYTTHDRKDRRRDSLELCAAESTPYIPTAQFRWTPKDKSYLHPSGK